MEENTYTSVFHYIKQSNKPVSPHELSRETGKSRVSVHMALKKLLEQGDIQKNGNSPRVYYTASPVSPETIPHHLQLDRIKTIIEPILKKYPIIYAGIFGSVARGEETAISDIDIMIDYHRPFSLISLIGLENELSQALGKKVDVITERGASKYMKAEMLKDLKIIYGSR